MAPARQSTENSSTLIGERVCSREAVLEQLRLILESDLFKTAAQHQSLLKTIVVQSYDRHLDALKEIVLARDVLGKADYDPQRHTLVRVEINSIRSKLAQYYSIDRPDDLVRIEIPRGRYVATFSPLRAVVPQEPSSFRWGAGLLAAFGLLAVLLILFLLWPRHHPPSIPTPITFDAGLSYQPAVSADGETLVFVSDRGPQGYTGIWIRESGKEPRPLTNDAAPDLTPDISPDGSRVVYRSWRKDPGIWSIATKGGSPQLVAPNGFWPRFSPDGKWIAFVRTEGEQELFIVAAEGGQPRRISHGVTECHCPVWFPDGKSLVFLGKGAGRSQYDFWAARIDAPPSQPSQPLGIEAKLNAQNLPTLFASGDCPQDWSGNKLLFVVQRYSTTFSLQVPFRSSGPEGEIQPIPSVNGAGYLRVARKDNRGRSLIFAAEQTRTNIWGTDPAGITPLSQLTHDVSLVPGFDGTWPSLSGDGNILAFITDRFESSRICLHDLRTGTETVLNALPSDRSRLLLDQTATKVLYTRPKDPSHAVILREIKAGIDRVITTSCPVLHDWSPDTGDLLCSNGNEVFLRSMKGIRDTHVIKLRGIPMQARLSSDRNWIACAIAEPGTESVAGVVAALDGSGRVMEICRDTYGLSLHWSPQNDGLYFWSSRDGFRCLYRQRVNAQTKNPYGQMTAILHRHTNQHYPWGGSTLAISRNRIAFTLKDDTANIWETNLPQ